MDSRTIDILNRLVAMHARSLPMYLASAHPYVRRGDEKATEALNHLVHDQQLMVIRLGTFIESQGGTVDLGEFPMEFTDLHDLSMDYLVQQVIRRQQNEIEEIDRLAAYLPDHSEAKALAREALGAAKAHLQSLQECQESAAPAGT